MNYIGIDLSYSATGLVIFEKQEALLFSDEIKSKGDLGANPEQDYYRAMGIVNKIIDIIKKIGTSRIALEGYAYLPTFGHTYSIGELGGLLKDRLRSNFLIFPTIIQPTQLKKYITGKGNADKTAMTLAVYKKYGMEFKSDNITDAYCLARIMYDSEHSAALNQMQFEILTKVFPDHA